MQVCQQMIAISIMKKIIKIRGQHNALVAPWLLNTRNRGSNPGGDIIYLYKASGFTGLFTGQFYTEDYSTFTDVI